MKGRAANNRTITNAMYESNLNTQPQGTAENIEQNNNNSNNNALFILVTEYSKHEPDKWNTHNHEKSPEASDT